MSFTGVFQGNLPSSKQRAIAAATTAFVRDAHRLIDRKLLVHIAEAKVLGVYEIPTVHDCYGYSGGSSDSHELFGI